METRKEYVKEYSIIDGIGAQLYRKIYAMSYAKYYGLPFVDTPIIDFLIHESDNIADSNQKTDLINKMLSLIEIKSDVISDHVLCNKVGAGLPESHGIIPNENIFLKVASDFNKINETENNVVIHMRRGNVTSVNPRWVDDEFYVNMLNNLNNILNKLEIKPDNVILLSDSPDLNKIYRPNEDQILLWEQQWLYGPEQLIRGIDRNKFLNAAKQINNFKIINNLDTYNSFLLMLKAKLLITSKSAFSNTAALLSKNQIITLDGRLGDMEKIIGKINKSGQLIK